MDACSAWACNIKEAAAGFRKGLLKIEAAEAATLSLKLRAISEASAPPLFRLPPTLLRAAADSSCNDFYAVAWTSSRRASSFNNSGTIFYFGVFLSAIESMTMVIHHSAASHSTRTCSRDDWKADWALLRACAATDDCDARPLAGRSAAAA